MYRCKCGNRIFSDRRVRCGVCGTTSRGLGSYVAQAINAVGGNHVAKLYERLTGKPCGCKRREAWLDELGEQLRGSFRRRDDV
jgi:hypothetical protein